MINWARPPANRFAQFFKFECLKNGLEVCADFWTPALAEVSYKIGSVRTSETQDLRNRSKDFSDFLHEVRGS